MGHGCWSLWSKTCHCNRGHHSVSNFFLSTPCVAPLMSLWKRLKCGWFCLTHQIVYFYDDLDLTTYLRIIFNTLFGLSANYWMAIVTRFLLGSLNGLLGPIRVSYCSVYNMSFILINHWFLCHLPFFNAWFNFLMVRHMQVNSSGKNTNL